MVEALGHRKAIRKLRCGWIDEGKPKKEQGHDSDHENLSATASPGMETDPSARQFNLTPDVASPPNSEAGHDPDQPNFIGHGVADSEVQQGTLEQDVLDQLLAEEPQANAGQIRNSSNSLEQLSADVLAQEEKDFGEEEEIMRQMEFEE